MQSGCLCLIVLSSCSALLSSSKAYSSISSAIFFSSCFLPFLNIIIQIQTEQNITQPTLSPSKNMHTQSSQPSPKKNHQQKPCFSSSILVLWRCMNHVSTLLVAILFYNMGEQQKKQSSLDYKDVENGPLTEANRQCRDIFCCLFFLINIVWMFYATGFAYNTGNTTKIFRPISAVAGEICGQPGNTAEAYPYIYFSNPMDLQTRRFCVMSCPSGTDATFTTTAAGGGTITFDVNIASDGTATPSTWTSGDDVAYFSTVAAGRVCIPSTETFNKAFSSYTSTFASLQQGDLANFILDVKNNWQWLLAAFGFAILISFLFMYMLRCLAGCIVWCSIFGIILFFTGAGLVFLYNAGVITGFGNYSGYLSIPSSSASQKNYEVYGYISFAFAGLFLLITLCCCSRIRLAVAVCKAAGQFVASVCTSVLVPIFQTIFALGLWGGCLVVMVFLVSTANFYIANNSDYFTSVKYGDGGLIDLYIFIFSTLWANALIQAIGIFVIASACAMWYYSHGPEQTLDFPILRSYKMAFRYHFGSLAFGSLVLAIVQFLELMVQAFKKQAEAAGGENKCTQCLTNFLRCCLACVQRIVEFINKTAYIQIAIRGKSFCYAAKDGFEMVFSNVLRYSIVSGVGSILMFIGKLLIALGTAGAFYLLIIYYPGARINVLQPIYLLIIVFIMAYAVGTLFMVVYTLAMDTLLACFIIDEANSKAKGGKAPQYAPEDLAALMETD